MRAAWRAVHASAHFRAARSCSMRISPTIRNARRGVSFARFVLLCSSLKIQFSNCIRHGGGTAAVGAVLSGRYARGAAEPRRAAARMRCSGEEILTGAKIWR